MLGAVNHCQRVELGHGCSPVTSVLLLRLKRTRKKNLLTSLLPIPYSGSNTRGWSEWSHWSTCFSVRNVNRERSQRFCLNSNLGRCNGKRVDKRSRRCGTVSQSREFSLPRMQQIWDLTAKYFLILV